MALLLNGYLPHLQILSKTSGYEKRGEANQVFVMFVVIGNGAWQWQLLPSWLVPMTLAMFADQVCVMIVVIGTAKWQLLPSWLVVWTLAMFSNTATTMVGTPCLTTANLPIPSTLSRRDEKGGQS